MRECPSKLQSSEISSRYGLRQTVRLLSQNMALIEMQNTRVERRNRLGFHFKLHPEDREALGRQLLHHQAQVRKLSRLLNEGSWVLRLPEELIAKIFQLHVSSWLRTSRRQPLRDSDVPALRLGYYGWLCGITHICTRWRWIALHTPSLWTSIKMFRPEAIDAFIERSTPLPVSIYCPHDYETSPSHNSLMRKKILQVAHRVVALNLETSTVDIVGDYAQKRFPVLRELALAVAEGNGASLPSYISGFESVPNLHTLQTSFYSFSAVRNLLHCGIRHLSLTTSLHHSAQPNTDWHAFLMTFQSLPEIETLYISHCLPFTVVENDQLQSYIATIDFNHLQSITVEGYSVACAVLLHHITYPRSAVVTIMAHARVHSPNLDDREQNLSDLRTFTHPLAAKLSRLSQSRPITSLSVDSYNGFGGVQIHVNTPREEDATRVTSRASLIFLGYSPKSIFNVVLRALPLKDTHTLSIGDLFFGLGIYTPSREDWLTGFADTIGIRNLSLQLSITTHFPSALNLPQTPHDSPSRALFPNLTIFRVQTDIPRYILDQNFPLSSEWVRRLCDALEGRAGDCKRLKEFEFSGTDKPTTILDPLLPHVSEVRWTYTA